MQSQIPAHVNQLQSVTEVLLNETSDESLLEQACADLYTLLATAGGEPCAQALAKINSTRLIAGLAISPADAANCIKDAKRTAVFLRGVRDAAAGSAGGKSEGGPSISTPS